MLYDPRPPFRPPVMRVAAARRWRCERVEDRGPRRLHGALRLSVVARYNGSHASTRGEP